MTMFQRGARRQSSAPRRSRGATKAGASLILALATSVALFASLNAWWSRPEPLAHTYESPEALAEAVMEAIAGSDIKTLQTLALTEEEFRNHVWPELPASRPERNVPFDFVWDMLHQNSEGHLQQTLAGFRDHQLTLTLKGVEFGGPSSAYDDVTVYRETELIVEAADGRERRIRLFGSMIEHDGGWKVFSYVVND